MVRVLIALVMMASIASAEPRRLDVVGTACDVTTLADQVVKLGGERFDAGARAIAFVELVAPFGARVSFDDGDGRVSGPRVIDAPSCEELVASIALVIAMTRATAPHGPAPIPDHDLAITRSVEIGPPPPTEGWDAIVGGAGSVDTSRLGGRLALGARWRRGDRSLGAELRGDLPDDHTLAIGRVDVYRADLAIVPCLHRGELAACGLATIGIWRGSGVGLATERAVFAPVAALGLRVAWEPAITRRLTLRAHIDADALVTTTRFDVDAMPVWASPRVEATAGLSLLARFP
jgi:hypothetical protein